jgi:hypothetical protein
VPFGFAQGPGRAPFGFAQGPGCTRWLSGVEARQQSRCELRCVPFGFAQGPGRAPFGFRSGGGFYWLAERGCGPFGFAQGPGLSLRADRWLSGVEASQ